MSQPLTDAAGAMAQGDAQLAAAAVLTIAEAAKLLRIGRNSMYEAARRGQIPTVRIGRRLLVPRIALDRMLESAGESLERGPTSRDR